MRRSYTKLPLYTQLTQVLIRRLPSAATLIAGDATMQSEPVAAKIILVNRFKFYLVHNENSSFAIYSTK